MSHEMELPSEGAYSVVDTPETPEFIKVSDLEKLAYYLGLGCLGMRQAGFGEGPIPEHLSLRAKAAIKALDVFYGVELQTWGRFVEGAEGIIRVGYGHTEAFGEFVLSGSGVRSDPHTRPGVYDNPMVAEAVRSLRVDSNNLGVLGLEDQRLTTGFMS